MQPKFCMYCGKDVSAFLSVALGLLFCPFCAGDLNGMEDRFLGVITVPDLEAAPEENRMAIAAPGKLADPRPDKQAAKKAAPKKKEKPSIRQRINRLLKKAGDEGLPLNNLNQNMPEKAAEWKPVLQLMIDSGEVSESKERLPGAVRDRTVYRKARTASYDAAAHILNIILLSDKGVTKSGIVQKTQNMTKPERDRVIQRLVNTGKIKEKIVPPGFNGGSDRLVYFPVSQKKSA